MKSTIIISIISGILLTGCMANIQPKLVKKNPNSEKLEKKGKAILKKAHDAHGVDNLLRHDVYQFVTIDDWKGPLAGMGKLWPEKNTKMEFKYAINTFDARVKFLSGSRINQSVGLQSWKFYEGEGDSTNFNVEHDERLTFGLAAFQYFSELTGRLENAEIIRYGGEKEFKNVKYDLVFVTWKQEDAHKEFDQYLLYINKTTNLIDYATYTIRDNYLHLPGTKIFYGTIGFSNFKDVDGYKVPFTQSIFLFGPKKQNSKYLHQLNIESFSFDEFEKEELYPRKDLQAVGDKKL